MKTWIEINAQNLNSNLALFKTMTNKKVMFAVKANAYGHGLKEIVEITSKNNLIDYYAVDSLNEALTVREIDKNKNILVIGWEDDEQLYELIAKSFEIIVPSLDYFIKVNEIAKKLGRKSHVHLKIETGTSRLGMPPSEILKIFNHQDNNIKIIGLYSHFANIEDTTDHSYAQHQLKIFNQTLNKLKGKKIVKHFSCSASTLLFPSTYFDMVRIGISAYGYWPSKQTYISYIEQNKTKINLKPVLAWYSRVAQVKQLKKGEYISYGLTYRTFNKSKIVVVPVGYYDGYDRKLSNLSNIIINGSKAPVRGRICMDMFMAEVSHVKNVSPNDKVILIGENNGEKISADSLAELIGTISYEVLARINPLIPRIVVEE